MKEPEWVTDKASWRKYRRRVLKRTSAFLAGEADVVTTAREISKLEFWLRASDDEDFVTFSKIHQDTASLPASSERIRWPSPEKTAEDQRFEEAENRWKEAALAAAESLRNKYE